MASPIFVVGHINPDTDSIASAIGYSWLLNERDGVEAVAARAGPCNPQTNWVLKYLDLPTPRLLTDASPRFEAVTRRLDTTTPEKPLRDAWAIASRTGGIAPVLNEDGTPYGLINGESIFEFLSRLVGPHPRQHEMRVSEFMDIPCHQAADTGVPKFQYSVRIRDVLPRILREDHDRFWVLDEDGRYSGICRRRDLLHPPRIELVLVDHNEPQQSIASLDEADLIEILDHHRLGNHSTHVPIRFTVDVVGSTSTLVSEKIEDAGLSAPPEIAAILLAGLLADTLVLASPTTTPRDREAVQRLARWAFVGGSILADETVETFGKNVIASGAGLSSRTADEIVNGDIKEYQSGGYQFTISQAEVSDLHEVGEHLGELETALSHLRESQGLDFAILMVTDVVQNSSKLLMNNPPPLLDDMPYPPESDSTRLAEGVVSRKKQLLPVIFSLLEA